MSESVAGFFSPFAYKVNNFSALDQELVEAYRTQNRDKIENLLWKKRPNKVEVHITINKYLHACVVIRPSKKFEQLESGSKDLSKAQDNPMCWRIELCFEDIKSKRYQIVMKQSPLQQFQEYIKESYYIGTYKVIHKDLCFQLAALRAAPNQYNAIFADCVEFAKNFCLELLKSNSKENNIHASVKENIKKTTATGSIVEYMSRNVRSLGHSGNSAVGGSDVVSFLFGNRSFWVNVCCFIYPFIGLLFVLYIYENYISIRNFSLE